MVVQFSGWLLAFHTTGDLPHDLIVPSLLAFVHSMLPFDPERSTGPLPYSCACKDIVDEYLMHEFSQTARLYSFGLQQIKA